MPKVIKVLLIAICAVFIAAITPPWNTAAAHESSRLEDICPSGCVLMDEATARKLTEEIRSMRRLIDFLTAEYQAEAQRKKWEVCT